MIIDSHHHLWDLQKRDYPWMSPNLKPIYRNFSVEDLATTIKPYDVKGAVLVQAHQSVEETLWMLDIAEKSVLIRGVVGWVDLKDPGLDEILAQLKTRRKLKGVRHIIQDEPDVNWMLQTDVIRGLQMVHKAGLTYDLLIKPHQLDNALRLIEHLPAMSLIVDHIAKPYIKDGKHEPWATQMRQLAKHSHVYCKISGLITEANPQRWKPEDFTFYLEHIVEIFGWDRICWGSDWPVCLLAGDYGQVLHLPEKLLKPGATDQQWAQFMGINAQKFYRLEQMFGSR
jgi:L-fuconolactonase